MHRHAAILLILTSVIFRAKDNPITKMALADRQALFPAVKLIGTSLKTGDIRVFAVSGAATTENSFWNLMFANYGPNLFQLKQTALKD